ncbi:CopD family protein [Methylobrevis sp. L22]|uniref:Protoporphyrinogen IX oxidase n=2 Tax=Methylobrevis albus TaxID=2793297 RepID=A0A931I123_9HYPH|nr:CopD family protein [Methylobrevis albus]
MIWSAGLVCLPGLYVQRAHVASGPSLHRLQGLVRFLYVAAMSPAAFVAIGSGTALIFLRETWAPWFGAKLFFVGLMATIHIMTGLVIIRLFDDGQIYPVWRFLAVTVVTVVIIAAILFLVLAKPDLAAMLPAALPDWMAEPGGLGRWLGELSPFPRS